MNAVNSVGTLPPFQINQGYVDNVSVYCPPNTLDGIYLNSLSLVASWGQVSFIHFLCEFDKECKTLGIPPPRYYLAGGLMAYYYFYTYQEWYRAGLPKSFRNRQMDLKMTTDIDIRIDIEASRVPEVKNIIIAVLKRIPTFYMPFFCWERHKYDPKTNVAILAFGNGKGSRLDICAYSQKLNRGYFSSRDCLLGELTAFIRGLGPIFVTSPYPLVQVFTDRLFRILRVDKPEEVNDHGFLIMIQHLMSGYHLENPSTALVLEQTFRKTHETPDEWRTQIDGYLLNHPMDQEMYRFQVYTWLLHEYTSPFFNRTQSDLKVIAYLANPGTRTLALSKHNFYFPLPTPADVADFDWTKANNIEQLDVRIINLRFTHSLDPIAKILFESYFRNSNQKLELLRKLYTITKSVALQLQPQLIKEILVFLKNQFDDSLFCDCIQLLKENVSVYLPEVVEGAKKSDLFCKRFPEHILSVLKELPSTGPDYSPFLKKAIPHLSKDQVIKLVDEKFVLICEVLTTLRNFGANEALESAQVSHEVSREYIDQCLKEERFNDAYAWATKQAMESYLIPTLIERKDVAKLKLIKPDVSCNYIENISRFFVEQREFEQALKWMGLIEDKILSIISEIAQTLTTFDLRHIHFFHKALKTGFREFISSRSSKIHKSVLNALPCDIYADVCLATATPEQKLTYLKKLLAENRFQEAIDYAKKESLTAYLIESLISKNASVALLYFLQEPTLMGNKEMDVFQYFLRSENLELFRKIVVSYPYFSERSLSSFSKDQTEIYLDVIQEPSLAILTNIYNHIQHIKPKAAFERLRGRITPSVKMQLPAAQFKLVMDENESEKKRLIKLYLQEGLISEACSYASTCLLIDEVIPHLITNRQTGAINDLNLTGITDASRIALIEYWISIFSHEKAFNECLLLAPENAKRYLLSISHNFRLTSTQAKEVFDRYPEHARTVVERQLELDPSCFKRYVETLLNPSNHACFTPHIRTFSTDLLSLYRSKLGAEFGSIISKLTNLIPPSVVEGLDSGFFSSIWPIESFTSDQKSSYITKLSNENALESAISYALKWGLVEQVIPTLVAKNRTVELLQLLRSENLQNPTPVIIYFLNPLNEDGLREILEKDPSKINEIIDLSRDFSLRRKKALISFLLPYIESLTLLRVFNLLDELDTLPLEKFIPRCSLSERLKLLKWAKVKGLQCQSYLETSIWISEVTAAISKRESLEPFSELLGSSIFDVLWPSLSLQERKYVLPFISSDRQQKVHEIVQDFLSVEDWSELESFKEDISSVLESKREILFKSAPVDFIIKQRIKPQSVKEYFYVFESPLGLQTFFGAFAKEVGQTLKLSTQELAYVVNRILTFDSDHSLTFFSYLYNFETIAIELEDLKRLIDKAAQKIDNPEHPAVETIWVFCDKESTHLSVPLKLVEFYINSPVCEKYVKGVVYFTPYLKIPAAEATRALILNNFVRHQDTLISTTLVECITPIIDAILDTTSEIDTFKTLRKCTLPHFTPKSRAALRSVLSDWQRFESKQMIEEVTQYLVDQTKGKACFEDHEFSEEILARPTLTNFPLDSRQRIITSSMDCFLNSTVLVQDEIDCVAKFFDVFFMAKHVMKIEEDPNFQESLYHRMNILLSAYVKHKEFKLFRDTYFDIISTYAKKVSLTPNERKVMHGLLTDKPIASFYSNNTHIEKLTDLETLTLDLMNVLLNEQKYLDEKTILFVLNEVSQFLIKIAPRVKFLNDEGILKLHQLLLSYAFYYPNNMEYTHIQENLVRHLMVQLIPQNTISTIFTRLQWRFDIPDPDSTPNSLPIIITSAADVISLLSRNLNPISIEKIINICFYVVNRLSKDPTHENIDVLFAILEKIAKDNLFTKSRGSPFLNKVKSFTLSFITPKRLILSEQPYSLLYVYKTIELYLLGLKQNKDLALKLGYHQEIRTLLMHCIILNFEALDYEHYFKYCCLLMPYYIDEVSIQDSLDPMTELLVTIAPFEKSYAAKQKKALQSWLTLLKESGKEEILEWLSREFSVGMNG